MNRKEYLSTGYMLTTKRGNELPQAKLTPEKVTAIRENRHGKTRKQLAAEFGVHYRTIEKIHYGETWGNV